MAYSLRKEEEAVVCKVIVLKLAQQTEDGRVFAGHAFLADGTVVEEQVNVTFGPDGELYQRIEFGTPGGEWQVTFDGISRVSTGASGSEGQGSRSGWDGKSMIWASECPEPPGS